MTALARTGAAPMSSDRAARNATCCDHAASDHDTHGCAVDVSTYRRTYERCHGLVPICGAESLWPGVICQKPPHDEDSHEANHPRPGRRGGIVTSLWSTAAVEADKRGECPGCLRRICVCPCQCDMCAARKAAR